MTPLNYLGMACAIVAMLDMVAALVLAMRGRPGSLLLTANFLLLGAMVQLKFFD